MYAQKEHEITDILILRSDHGWFYGRLRPDGLCAWALHERISGDFPDRETAQIFSNLYQEGQHVEDNSPGSYSDWFHYL